MFSSVKVGCAIAKRNAPATPFWDGAYEIGPPNVGPIRLGRGIRRNALRVSRSMPVGTGFTSQNKFFENLVAYF